MQIYSKCYVKEIVKVQILVIICVLFYAIFRFNFLSTTVSDYFDLLIACCYENYSFEVRIYIK